MQNEQIKTIKERLGGMEVIKNDNLKLLARFGKVEMLVN
jgi:hypothetical protein